MVSLRLEALCYASITGSVFICERLPATPWNKEVCKYYLKSDGGVHDHTHHKGHE